MAQATPSHVPDEKVFVNFTGRAALVDYLAHHRLEDQIENDILTRGLRVRASIVYEELAAFEYEETPTLMTTRSVSAWKRVLDAFGLVVDDDTIRLAMSTWLENKGIRSHSSYNDTIYNYDDVKDIADTLGYVHDTQAYSIAMRAVPTPGEHTTSDIPAINERQAD